MNSRRNETGRQERDAPGTDYLYHKQGSPPRRRGVPRLNLPKREGKPGVKPPDSFWKHVKVALIVLAGMALVLNIALRISNASWQKKIQESKRNTPGRSTRPKVRPTSETGIVQSQDLHPESMVNSDADAEALRQALEWVTRGETLQAEGKHSEAIKDYLKALDKWPHLPSVWAKLGQAYLQTRAFSRAQSALERAIRYEPNRPDLLNDLGVAYLTQNRTDQAHKLFNQALEIDPDYARGYFNLALCFIALNDRTQARENLQRYLKLEPGSAAALRDIAYLDAAMGDYEAAVQRLQEAMVTMPDWGLLYLDAAAAEALLGRFDRCREFLLEAERVTPAPDIREFLQQPAFKKFRDAQAGKEYVAQLIIRARKKRTPVPEQPEQDPSTEPLVSTSPDN
jgi:tetratricopeptide (TPR) repeat protein